MIITSFLLQTGHAPHPGHRLETGPQRILLELSIVFNRLGEEE